MARDAARLDLLRTIRSGDDGLFVPTLAVLVAVAQSFVAIGFLIFFVHHIAASIQATSIIARAASETLAAVDRLFPSELGQPASDRDSTSVDASLDSWVSVPAANTGYLLSVDGDALFELARQNGVVVRMERAVGDFVIEGTPLVPAAAEALDHLCRRNLLDVRVGNKQLNFRFAPATASLEANVNALARLSLERRVDVMSALSAMRLAPMLGVKRSARVRLDEPGRARVVELRDSRDGRRESLVIQLCA